MPKPTGKKEILILLSFINYLAKFLPRPSEVAQRLRDLTLANAQFIWSEQHDKAFDEVKKLVINYPVLKYCDINNDVTIQCDVSERGLGATLLPNGQPVAFASRTLYQVEQRHAGIEKNVWPLCLVANSSHSTSHDERTPLSNQILSRCSQYSRNNKNIKK